MIVGDEFYMKITKIYFDMDGVLADFDKGIRELCSMDPLPQSEDQPVGYDDELWSKVREAGHFYDKLELIPGTKELFDYVYGKYGDRCEILTGIPKPRRGIITAGEDKINWVRRLLSKDVVVNIVWREDKPDYCSGKDCILIDDYALNITEWEQCGGTGILFYDAESALEELKKLENAF